MPTVMIECSDLNDPEAINRAAEQVVGKCDITYYRQHEGMIEAGKSKSERESARIMADESGETFNAVHNRIRRGKKRVCQPDTVENSNSKAIYEPDRIEIYNGFISEKLGRAYILKNGYDEDIGIEKTVFNLYIEYGVAWIRAEESAIFYWYAKAFKELGKDVRIADGWRIGYTGCKCKKCQGKVARTPLFKGTTMTPRINETISDRGYIDYKMTMKHWNKLRSRFEKLCRQDAA